MIRNLSPLARTLPLEQFVFTPKNITKGIEGIRRMKSLKKIGIHWAESQQVPAEEFWKKYDAGEFSK